MFRQSHTNLVSFLLPGYPSKPVAAHDASHTRRDASYTSPPTMSSRLIRGISVRRALFREQSGTASTRATGGRKTVRRSRVNIRKPPDQPGGAIGAAPHNSFCQRCLRQPKLYPIYINTACTLAWILYFPVFVVQACGRPVRSMHRTNNESRRYSKDMRLQAQTRRSKIGRVRMEHVCPRQPLKSLSTRAREGSEYHPYCEILFRL